MSEVSILKWSMKSDYVWQHDNGTMFNTSLNIVQTTTGQAFGVNRDQASEIIALIRKNKNNRVLALMEYCSNVGLT